ncbi:MAG: hypothetical protein ACXVQ6_04700 [Actinomycetota bacterium]
MNRRRRALITLAIIIAVLIGAFFGYGWWTRRGGVSFSKGGKFNASPSATATAADLPKVGVYTFTGIGSEHVKLGSVPACSWDVKDVTLTLSQDPLGMVFDLTLSKGRVEREIYSYKGDDITLDFSASTVTCFGIRTTTQDTYKPPAARYKVPFTVGQTWTTHAVTEDRTEDATGTVLRAETVTVPAGTFSTYVVELRGTFTGSQSGSFSSLTWFAPSIHTWVRTIAKTDATRGGATFTSNYTLELTKAP